jgi:hypothetical protein
VARQSPQHRDRRRWRQSIRAQNSQNLAFYQSLIDVDPHHHGVQTGPISPVGTYDIQEQIVAPHHDVLADIHSVLLLA